MLTNPVLHKEILRMRLRQPKPARLVVLGLVTLGLGYFYWVSITNLLDAHNSGLFEAMWILIFILFSFR